MAQQSIAAAANPTDQTADASAVFRVLGDGTVLYKTRQQAESAGVQKTAAPSAAGVTTLSQSSASGKYLSKGSQALPGAPGDPLEFPVTGFIVVMVVMAGLCLAWSALSRLLGSLERSVAQKSEASAARSLLSSPGQPELASGMHPGLTDQQLIVLLTAAAFEVMNVPVRITGVRPFSPGNSSWAAEGRNVLHSHRLK